MNNKGGREGEGGGGGGGGKERERGGGGGGGGERRKGGEGGRGRERRRERFNENLWSRQINQQLRESGVKLPVIGRKVVLIHCMSW